VIDVTYRINVPWMPARQGVISLIYPPTVMDLLGALGVEEDKCHNFLVVVNRKNRLPEDYLEEGDHVVILPAMCGG